MSGVFALSQFVSVPFSFPLLCMCLSPIFPVPVLLYRCVADPQSEGKSGRSSANSGLCFAAESDDMLPPEQPSSHSQTHSLCIMRTLSDRYGISFDCFGCFSIARLSLSLSLPFFLSFSSSQWSLCSKLTSGGLSPAKPASCQRASRGHRAHKAPAGTAPAQYP